ncbi:hypothetical protein ACOJUY_004240 [Vibrio alginolyticus]|nr:hypothetical protein [Vibrio parahaemolyticus]
MKPLFNSQSKGFTIAEGSDISPQDLAKSGFIMEDFKFHPHNIEAVRELLYKQFANRSIKSNFVVTDESTFLNRIYRFKSCPF